MQRSLQVLLADDKHDFADGLAAALASAGHTVRVAYDGHAALRLLRQTMPEVGLFDLGLPGLDGFDLAEALRSHPGGRDCLLVDTCPAA